MIKEDEQDQRGEGIWRILMGCSGTAQDRRNQLIFTAWVLVWGASYVAATWLLNYYEPLQGPAIWFVAALPTLMGFVALRFYLRFLRMADELMKKIQLEGLAIGFGIGIIFILGYQVLEYAGAPGLSLNYAGAIMMVGWAFGQIYSAWRYK
ncbi:hypothetical protein [Emcibacter sp.]|uniref:hypothetical protein n=1 Tax=Emcibacter sp. TaxID=1979954 RepID=UPI003A90FE8E